MGKDSWETELGLLDDYDLTITRAYFATDARYNNGESLLLHLEGTTDNADTLESQVLFACGTGWVSNDGGKTAVHEKGKGRFNRSSWYGRLIERMKELGGIDALAQRGDATQAQVWEGITLHLVREEVDFGSGIEAKSHLMPTAWRVGDVATGKPAAKSTAKSATVPAAAATPTAQPTAPIPETPISPKLLVQAKVLFKKHTTYGDWLTACMALDGFDADEAFMMAVIDPTALWAELGGAPVES